MPTLTPTTYTHRFLARFVIEAVTPLAVGSGEKDMITDALIATDVNGLPYIPGTSIAGVLRSMIVSGNTHPDEIDKLFGCQKQDEGRGSEIIFTEAKILNHKGEVVDGLQPLEIQTDSLLRHYQDLPIRQHVRMNDRGTAEDKGKFDEQVVYAGTRFCFEIEMVSDGSNDNRFAAILQHIFNRNFRIGSGTRSGFGEIKVVELKVMTLNLENPSDLSVYLAKSSSLATDFWTEHSDKLNKDLIQSISNPAETSNGADYLTYTLSLTPDSFFLFGSGFGDDEADMTPVKEDKVIWNVNKSGQIEGHLDNELVLIPATSVKGALAHRVAFHWNNMNGVFADDLYQQNLKREDVVGKRNYAVKTLFGSEGDSDDKEITKGNIIFSDMIQIAKLKDKIFNHVAIDRFTGGTIEGALFSEKVTYGEGVTFIMTVSVDQKGLKKVCQQPEEVLKALERALQDICNGMLPLGGGVNRGHGIFTGTLTKS